MKLTRALHWCKANIPLLLMLTMTLILGFFRIAKQSYWFDEGYTVYITRHPDVFRTAIRQDFNMWFYYLLLIPWERLFGYTETATRSLSVICTIATGYVCYLIASGTDKRSARWLVLFFPLNVSVILYSQEARSYALSLFLTSLSSYLVLRYRNTRAWYVAYAGITIIALYTHIYTGFVFAAQLVVFLWSRTYKPLLVLPAVITAAAPLIVMAVKSSSTQVFWSAHADIPSVITFFYTLFGGRLFIIIFLLSLLNLPNLKSRTVKLLGLWAVLPVAVLILMTVAGKPMLVERYAVFVVPPFLLLAARGAARIRNWYIITFTVLLALYTGMPSLIGHYTTVRREQFREAAAEICANISYPVIPYPYFIKTALLTYIDLSCPGKAGLVLDPSSEPYSPGGAAGAPPASRTVMDTICRNNRNVLLIVRNQGSRYYGWQLDSSPIRNDLVRCMTPGRKTEYKGLTAYYYSR